MKKARGLKEKKKRSLKLITKTFSRKSVLKGGTLMLKEYKSPKARLKLTCLKSIKEE